MTTPRVIELPRRLEPTSLDTFLGGCDDRPPAVVVALRPRDGAGRRRSRARALRPTGDPGPGGQAA